MELQGVVLAGAVLISAFYVLPYIYRRRHILAQAPLDDGYSEDLRMLKLDDAHVSKGAEHDESHGDVLTGRNEVVMSKIEANGTGMDVRLLARERARRRARVAKREANRTRGIVGAIVFGVVLAGLWTVSAVFSVTIVLPIVASVLFAVYACGLVYLLGQMDKANAADLDAIVELDEQMKSLRRSVSQRAHRRATTRVGSNRRGGVLESRRGVVPSVEQALDAGAVIMDSTASQGSAHEKHISYSAVSSVPSYTLKRPQVVQRDIAPFVPPTMPEAEVPYRPMKLGERLDVSSIKGDVSGGGDVSLEGLGGGALLDDVLARRRA